MRSWDTSTRRAGRLAGPGNQLRWGKFSPFPHVNAKGGGTPPDWAWGDVRPGIYL